MAIPSPKLSFPRLHRMTLRSFSLYSLQPVVDAEFGDGVFCLAGANGLGKSTFLSALNYALTGIVSDPNRRFDSVEEYYRHSLPYSSSYFSGRISERDRDAAEVSLEFSVGKTSYKITRGMFEPDELRMLWIGEKLREDSDIVLDATQLSPGDRHQKYTEHLTKNVGLISFEQFAFLQHFVLTFDERRHLLFWDQRVLEQALYLAFGVNPADAKRADALKRESEKADSLARNFNWQASDVRKKIRDLRATASHEPEAAEDLSAEHQQLFELGETAEALVAKLEGEQRDVSLQLAALSAREVSLKTQYSEEFARRVKTHTHIAQHPLIVSSISDCLCGLCGTESPEISESIQKKISTNTCVLCGSAVQKTRGAPKDITKLREIDANLATVKAELENVVKKIGRISSEIAAAIVEKDKHFAQLAKFETENATALSKLRLRKEGDSGVDSVLAVYEKQMQELLERKAAQYQRRDERRRELRKLQEALERQYLTVEKDFVPLFRELAYRFLGIDLDVRMETQGTSGINLVLDVRSAARRQHHQLSESQRFFVDIALRMALAQFMSTEKQTATLFIDTPEGSLDIAYEKRAGDMLAEFVARDYHIVMTANINSSRLLQELATRVGKKKMFLCRMTSWTELSEVQVEEEDLFEEAYAVIEGSLNPKRGARK